MGEEAAESRKQEDFAPSAPCVSASEKDVHTQHTHGPHPGEEGSQAVIPPSPPAVTWAVHKDGATCAAAPQKQKAADMHPSAPKKQMTATTRAVAPKKPEAVAMPVVAPKKLTIMASPTAGFFSGKSVPPKEEPPPPMVPSACLGRGQIRRRRADEHQGGLEEGNTKEGGAKEDGGGHE